jgi:putative CocE/NonD family hydrolase
VILFVAAFGAGSRVSAEPYEFSQPTIERDNISIPMRDGVALMADIFLPANRGRWPAILVRTPYSRRSLGTRGYRAFARRGYAVVIQDVRGRYGSAGRFGSIAQEGPDGSDTIDWVAHQSWSDGRVGMAGGSYLGIVQWWAAIQKNPRLVTIFPLVSGDDEYFDRFYSPGGALQLGHRLTWLHQNLTPLGATRPLFASYIDHLPLMNADVAATTRKLDIWRTALQHPSYDKYWNRLSVRRSLGNLNIPVCSMGGWFDAYVESDLNAFSLLARRGAPIETWIGPWAHNFRYRFTSIDFGPEGRPRARMLQVDWFDKFLKQGESPSGSLKPVLHIFVMGVNRWREEREWPLARTRYTALYLDSGGRANTSSGDGELRAQFGHDSPPDHFTYDPLHPVPTAGGALCCDARLMPPGPLDQREIERRRDVLVYTSPTLRRPLEVTGPVAATIYVATSANDTDFSAKVVDLAPDGHALLVTDGIARMRYRVSLVKPVLMKRDTPYQVHIDAGVTSWVFLPGHRIRLEISSSNFPRFDRNLNSSRPNAEETRINVAHQTVYHERRYPSVLVLPVIPQLRSFSAAAHPKLQRRPGDMGAH